MKGSNRPIPLKQWHSPKHSSQAEEEEEGEDAFIPLSPNVSAPHGGVVNVGGLPPTEMGHVGVVSGEDVKQALRDLHLLSTSLLEMDPT